ncbi:MAG: 2OG-Fe(II) oxygenase [Burkholderiales bacterium]
MEADLSAADHVVIRGRRLELDRCVDPKLFDPAYVKELRQQVRNAAPFPHLVADGWFNPLLLDLVREEFDLLAPTQWNVFRNDQELTHRSLPHTRLGPASEIYFGIVNAGWFLDLISTITDLEDLLPDPKLLGGGLHETRAGGKFGFHRDFDRHAHNGLTNKMVLMTYLNRGWDPAWGAALELWDSDANASVRSIPPAFGTTVILLHGPKSFHGHPEPMAAPAGQTRRSVAVYYYQNPTAVQMRVKRVSSVFLVAHRSKPLRYAVRRLLPPILLDAIKKLVAR